MAEVRQGRPAPMNLAWLSMRHGDALARRMMLLGHRIVGDELLRMGIAHDVVEDDLVLTTARALAEELAELPPAGISATKQILRRMDLPGRPNDWFALAAEAAADVGRASGPIPSLKR